MLTSAIGYGDRRKYDSPGMARQNALRKLKRKHKIKFDPKKHKLVVKKLEYKYEV